MQKIHTSNIKDYKFVWFSVEITNQMEVVYLDNPPANVLTLEMFKFI